MDVDGSGDIFLSVSVRVSDVLDSGAANSEGVQVGSPVGTNFRLFYRVTGVGTLIFCSVLISEEQAIFVPITRSMLIKTRLNLLLIAQKGSS